AAPPRHHAPEQVARHLVRGQPPLPAERAGKAVFGLDPEYAPVHEPNLRSLAAGVMTPPPYRGLNLVSIRIVRRRRPHNQGRCLVGLVSVDEMRPGKDGTMGSRSEPDPGLSAIMNERRQLINLAYRLLGSLAEAEDAVQETYARWYAMSREQQAAVQSPGAWLTTVASRICLDLLGSARARRERYVGEWLPEPLPGSAGPVMGSSGGAAADPADRITLDESVNMAFLVVLESMTPAERVAFILHDVFGYPFAEVAQIVGRTPAACRQLASSGRRRIRAAHPPAPPTARQAAIIR